MRRILCSLPILAICLALLLPAIARADTIGIDDFVLTGEGQVITFSSPATVVGRGSYGAGGSDGGFIDSPTNFQINGQPTSVLNFQVFSTFFPSYLQHGGFIIFTPARTYEIVGTVLYSAIRTMLPSSPAPSTWKTSSRTTENPVAPSSSPSRPKPLPFQNRPPSSCSLPRPAHWVRSFANEVR